MPEGSSMSRTRSTMSQGNAEPEVSRFGIVFNRERLRRRPILALRTVEDLPCQYFIEVVQSARAQGGFDYFPVRNLQDLHISETAQSMRWLKTLVWLLVSPDERYLQGYLVSLGNQFVDFDPEVRKCVPVSMNDGFHFICGASLICRRPFVPVQDMLRGKCFVYDVQVSTRPALLVELGNELLVVYFRHFCHPRRGPCATTDRYTEEAPGVSPRDSR